MFYLEIRSYSISSIAW